MRPISWRRNLAVIWLSQFCSIMGFSFAMPFTPFYVQELGVTDPDQVTLWVSICSAATPLALALFSPLWGVLGDRYGRRIMLLRANFAAAAIVALMGLVGSVEALAALRFLQGVFTGTVTAAQTMIAASTPQERSGLALGSLSAAVFSGGMVGAAVGGVVADAFGCRAAFLVGGGIILVAGLLVLFGSREAFARPEAAPSVASLPSLLRAAARSAVMPIMLLIVLLAFVRQFDGSFLPLFVQQIHGSREGAAQWTGILQAASGLAGLLAGFSVGRLADRIPPARLAMAAALGAGVLMVPHGFARGLALMCAVRFLLMYCAAALDPVFQTWLAKITPPERRGLVFGFSATAKSLGWFGAPIVSGAVVSAMGLRWIYFVGAGLFMALVPSIGFVAWRARRGVPKGAARCIE
jgi:DHA1 family multidrug resistance protein-like MFS transporter